MSVWPFCLSLPSGALNSPPWRPSVIERSEEVCIFPFVSPGASGELYNPLSPSTLTVPICCCSNGLAPFEQQQIGTVNVEGLNGL